MLFCLMPRQQIYWKDQVQLWHWQRLKGSSSCSMRQVLCTWTWAGQYFINHLVELYTCNLYLDLDRNRLPYIGTLVHMWLWVGRGGWVVLLFAEVFRGLKRVLLWTDRVSNYPEFILQMSSRALKGFSYGQTDRQSEFVLNVIAPPELKKAL